MSVAGQLKSLVAEHRPSGAASPEVTRLARLAADWFVALKLTLNGIRSDSFVPGKDKSVELALAIAEMADDLHADSGIWRTLEACNTALFGTPLPGLWRATDAPLTRFDARRFQFYLDGVWRHFKPHIVVSPRHSGFLAISVAAERFFSARLTSLGGPGSVAALLDAAHPRGWDVKRKLVWLGTHSFLLRFAYHDYVARQESTRDMRQNINLTDDFLCQECTGWSGLGALELLAGRLDLDAGERADLLGWHARHTAFYRVDAVTVADGIVMTMDLENLINAKPCRVRIEMPVAQIPFQVGDMVFGGLVPWRGEWYWSGSQQRFGKAPKDCTAIRRLFFEKSSLISYRYCLDRAAKARKCLEKQHEAFVRFHGSDLAIFPDGLAMAAAEQRRIRHYNQACAAQLQREGGKDLIGRDYVKNGPPMAFPPELTACERGVAVFSQPGEGNEIMREFDVLCTALRTGYEDLSDEQMETLENFAESPAISPAFVRRVVALHGSRGLAERYYLPPGDNVAFDHFLRRHKGAYYRPRPPDITLTDG